MKRTIFSLIILLFLLSSLSADIKLISSYDNAYLLEKEGKKIIILRGTPYQMGYQQGILLRKEIQENVEKVLAIAFSRQPGWLEKAWEKCKKFIPPEYREEMKGMADASGIPLRKIELVNIFPELFHCSGAVFFGRATRDGIFYHIRILDYMTDPNLQKNAVVMVHQPEGKIPFINASFAGFIGSVTGMNIQGIAIGEMGGGGWGKWEGVPMGFLLRKALEESKTLEEALKIFRDSPRTCEYYYVISEAKKRKAVAIRATPEEFQVLKPGEPHPLLPRPPLPDTLMISGETRYLKLWERVKENYGKIDLKILKEIIKRPVAMEHNLHNAIFIPEKGIMHLAIADNPSKPRYQACYQPYTEFNLPRLLAYRPPPPSSDSQTLTPSRILRIPPAKEKSLEKPLQLYRIPLKTISFTLTLISRQPDFDYYSLKFPSLYPLSLPSNDQVSAEYLLSRVNHLARGNKKPAVIILDIAQGNFQVARLIAHRLARSGINSLIIPLPLISQRNPGKELEERIKKDPFLILKAIIQGVNDIRVGTSWLLNRPETDPTRIGICGTSLGGMVGILSAGILQTYSRGVFVLSGGDLTELISYHWKDPRNKKLKEILEKLGGEKTLKKILHPLLTPYDPLTFTSRIKDMEILLINAENDEIIPTSSTLALKSRLPSSRLLWYPGGHYDLTYYAEEILDITATFLSTW